MNERRTVFLKNHARMLAALGDSIPAWTPDTQERAAHALVHEIYRAPDGSYTKLDLAAVDWTCSKTRNPPVVEMHLLRFAMLPSLAAGFLATGEDRYALAARQYIEAFLRDHPIRDGWAPAPYDGATQYDLRVGCTQNPGWLGTMGIFLGSPVFDDAFFEIVVAAARAHVLYLTKHVFPDNNIRVLHGDVLLCAGLWLSFLPEAARWQEQGLLITNDAIQRQILPDGVHSEAVPHYHGVALFMFARLWRIAQAMPEVGLNIPTERIAAMYDYALVTSRPDGAEVSIHDSRYTPAAAPADDLTARRRAEFRRQAKLPVNLPPLCTHYPDAGQVYLRDRWDADATYITFEATTQRSWHWHPSRNSITLYAGRRALLVDPGYVFSSPQWPAYGHRTEHHSTINLNGWNQSHSLASVRHRQAPGYDLVEGLYEGGYWPKEQFSHGAGIFGEHHRTLLWIRGRCIVVLDHVRCTSEADRKPTLECIWQLSEGQATLAGDRVTTQNPDSNLLMLLPVMPQGTAVTLHSGEREPMRGWLPLEWGRRCVAAPMVRLAAPAYDPWNAHFATVLVPYAGTQAPSIQINASGPDIGLGGSPAGKIELTWPDGAQDRVLWTPRLATAIEDQHDVRTDAGLVHLHLPANGQPAQALIVDGSQLAYRGNEVGGAAVIGSAALEIPW